MGLAWEEWPACIAGEDDEAIPRHPVMEYNSVEDAEGKFVIRSSLGGRDSAFLACGTEVSNPSAAFVAC